MRMSHPSPLPIAVTVFCVRSKWSPRLRLNCRTAEMRAISSRFLSPALHSVSSPSNFTTGLRNFLPPRRTSQRESSCERSSAYQTLFLQKSRTCRGCTEAERTEISAPRPDPTISSPRSSLSIKRNRSPCCIFRTMFFKKCSFCPFVPHGGALPTGRAGGQAAYAAPYYARPFGADGAQAVRFVPILYHNAARLATFRRRLAHVPGFC